MLKTTLNVSEKINKQLNETCLKFPITKRKIIGQILFLCHKNLIFENSVSGQLIDYQKKADSDNWKRIRIDFTEIEVDNISEYRKNFRISLSKLFATGFILYFQIILNQLKRKNRKCESEHKKLINDFRSIRIALIPQVSNCFIFFFQCEIQKT